MAMSMNHCIWISIAKVVNDLVCIKIMILSILPLQPPKQQAKGKDKGGKSQKTAKSSGGGKAKKKVRHPIRQCGVAFNFTI